MCERRRRDGGRTGDLGVAKAGEAGAGPRSADSPEDWTGDGTLVAIEQKFADRESECPSIAGD